MSTNGQSMRVLGWTADQTVIALSERSASELLRQHPGLGEVHKPSGRWADPSSIGGWRPDPNTVVVVIPARNRHIFDAIQFGPCLADTT